MGGLAVLGEKSLRGKQDIAVRTGDVGRKRSG